MKKQSNWMFIVEVWLFILTGFLISKNQFTVSMIIFLAGLGMAHLTGRRMIKECKVERGIEEA